MFWKYKDFKSDLDHQTVLEDLSVFFLTIERTIKMTLASVTSIRVGLVNGVGNKLRMLYLLMFHTKTLQC